MESNRLGSRVFQGVSVLLNNVLLLGGARPVSLKSLFFFPE